MSEEGRHLSFDELRYANALRCTDAYHAISEWTLTDWATAAAGEMGEVCGVVKKLRRISVDPDLAIDEQMDLLVDLGDEIADTIIYLDLLATRAGLVLERAIREKFNKTSEKVGSEVRL